jgi:hypothetical protein
MGVLGYKGRPGPGHALHSGSQVRGIPHGRVIHPEIVPDGANDHGFGINPDAYPGFNPAVLLDILPVFPYSVAQGHGRVTGPLCMVFISDRSSKRAPSPRLR